MSESHQAFSNRRLSGGVALTEYQFLVDNNVLSALSKSQRASKFFRARCRLPDEVLHEARGFPDIEALKTLNYETTADVLRHLIVVMATVPDTDTKLVDLYANRGNADPLLIACALDARTQDEDKLFGPVWVIVSDDEAVRAKAAEFQLELRTSGELLAILECHQAS